MFEAYVAFRARELSGRHDPIIVSYTIRTRYNFRWTLDVDRFFDKLWRRKSNRVTLGARIWAQKIETYPKLTAAKTCSQVLLERRGTSERSTGSEVYRMVNKSSPSGDYLQLDILPG